MTDTEPVTITSGARAARRLAAGLIAGIVLAIAMAAGASSAKAQLSEVCSQTLQTWGKGASQGKARKACVISLRQKGQQILGGYYSGYEGLSFSCKKAVGSGPKPWTCTCSARICKRQPAKIFDHGLPSPSPVWQKRNKGRGKRR